MTGADLARKLLKVRSDIPIILCTGYNEKISPDKAKKVGIREFLLKPQGKSELDLAIRRVMNAKSE
jgi:two-component system, cell cycle sensor histidine kinase and response regulator CckA